jgi:nitrile hydratase accessory protein
MTVPPATLPGLPGLPKDDAGPVFRAPWEAQAFALALALHERGAFGWPEFAAALTAAIGRAQAAGDADTGSTYYHHWLDALEALVLAKGLAGAAQLHALEHAWADAAARTPHGRPVVLGDDARALALR